MWFTTTAEGIQAWFALSSSTGALRTGEGSGSFTVTVVDPSDTNTNSPTVTESAAKPGLYTFTIPTAFLTTNGVGIYGIVIEVVTPAPILRDVISRPLRVTDFGFDDIGPNTALIPATL